MPKRGATTRKKPTRKASAAKPSARAPVSVTVRAPRRPIDEALVRKAMQTMRTESHAGPRLSAWAVDEDVLFEAAERYCLDQEAQHLIVGDIAADLKRAKVGPRAMETWLTRVRKEYRQCSMAVIDKQLDAGEVTRLGVDQVDQHALLQTKLNTKLLEAIEKIDLVDGDIKRLHVLTRIYTQGSEFARIQSDARLKARQAELAQAKATELYRKMKACADAAASAKAKGENPALAFDRLEELLRLAVAGEEPAEHVSRVEAA